MPITGVVPSPSLKPPRSRSRDTIAGMGELAATIFIGAFYVTGFLVTWLLVEVAFAGKDWLTRKGKR